MFVVATLPPEVLAALLDLERYRRAAAPEAMAAKPRSRP